MLARNVPSAPPAKTRRFCSSSFSRVSTTPPANRKWQGVARRQPAECLEPRALDRDHHVGIGIEVVRYTPAQIERRPGDRGAHLVEPRCGLRTPQPAPDRVLAAGQIRQAGQPAERGKVAALEREPQVRVAAQRVAADAAVEAEFIAAGAQRAVAKDQARRLPLGIAAGDERRGGQALKARGAPHPLQVVTRGVEVEASAVVVGRRPDLARHARATECGIRLEFEPLAAIARAEQPARHGERTLGEPRQA
jgi:hypothetical protein